MAIGQQFYSRGENRTYPFDPTSQLVSDDGLLLPEGIIADCSITLSSAYGSRVFVSAISHSAVSTVLTFASVSGVSLAIATIPATATPRRPIQLQALVRGVCGYVIPGEPIRTLSPINMRFSQAGLQLLPRVCFPAPASPEQNISVLNSRFAMSGIVTTESLGDMQVKVESRLLGGVTKKAIVFSLNVAGGAADILTRYAGDKQRRPESRSCGDPQPIETINEIAPDCCGRLYFEFRGCARPVGITNHCGVVLDCPQTPPELCGQTETYTEVTARTQDQCVAEGNPDPNDPPPNVPKLPPPWEN